MARRSMVTDEAIIGCLEELAANGESTSISAVCAKLHVGRSRVCEIQAKWLSERQLQPVEDLAEIPDVVRTALNRFLADAQRKFRAEASALNDEIKATLAEAITLQKTAEQERDDLAAQVAELKADAVRFQRERDQAQEDVRAAWKERDEAEGRLKQLRIEYDALERLHREAVDREKAGR